MHAARHGWDVEKDAPLFRNWAIHTGTNTPASFREAALLLFGCCLHAFWLSGWGVVPQCGRSLVRFPVSAHAWVVGLVSSGRLREAVDQFFSLTSMFVSLSLSLPPFSLKIDR